MAKQQIFSKEFFAAKYGFEPKELTYGIVHITGNGIDDEIRPVVLIEGDERFINILEHAVQPKRLPNLCMTFEKCEFIETNETICFQNEKDKITFSHKQIKDFYAGIYNV